MLSHIPILGYVGPGALTEGLFPRQNCCASLKSLSRGLLMLRCIYGQRPSKREGAFVPAVAVRELTESSPAGQLRSADNSPRDIFHWEGWSDLAATCLSGRLLRPLPLLISQWNLRPTKWSNRAAA